MTLMEYLNTDDKEKWVEYNKELIEKYPWVKPPENINYLGRVDDDYEYDYKWTELDELPHGWRIAFQNELLSEIQKVYERLPKETRESLYIFQAKEKYGGLRLYLSIHIDEIEEIIEKYEEISERTCVDCGKPATYISKGWICPWCSDHIRPDYPDGYVKIEDWFKGEDKNGI